MTAGGGTIDAAFAGALGGFTLDVAFSAPMHGITALFGPSGSGKTTVLRAVAGLNRLSGRLRVDGELWQDSAAGAFLKPHRRAIGYVFQEASLFGHLSVRRNLLYGFRRAMRAGAGRGLGFDDVVALLGLAPLLDRAPVTLSGGERQRVGVGRALLAQPRLLLMDEPLSGLDRAAKEGILPYFATLRDELTIPILYVSHDLAEVAWLADRMVVLGDGRRVAEGPTATVLERLDLRPATGRFEAGVVLAARILDHEPEFHLTRIACEGAVFTIPLVDAAPGQVLRVRVRARDVALALHRPEGTSFRNIVPGTVVEILEEPDSAFAETLVDIGGARLRARVTRKAVAELGLTVGTPVHALVKTVSFEGRTLAGRAL